MKEPRYDDEHLAALLAGRLKGPERDEMLAHLATHDDDAEVVINAAAVLREMEEEDAQAAAAAVRADPPSQREAVPPSVTRRARGWPRRTPRWAAISAVLVGLVVVGVSVSRGRTAAAGDPLRLAAHLENAGSGLPADWNANPPGRTTRGPADAEPTPANAALAGGYALRLVVAVESQDSAATVLLAERLQEFNPQAKIALQEMARRAGDPVSAVRPTLEAAVKRLEARFDDQRAYLRLGAWTEAARLAAQGENGAFFHTDDSDRMLRQAVRLTRDDEDAEPAVAEVVAALPPGGTPHWSDLKDALVRMQDAITR